MTEARRMSGHSISIALVVVIIAIGVAIEGGSVWAGKQRLETLCANRRLPTIYDAQEWSSWSRLVRMATDERGVDDPVQRRRLAELAEGRDITLRQTVGFPFKFPFQTVWVDRTELLRNGRTVAAVEHYYAASTGPISGALIGKGVGSRSGCNDNKAWNQYLDLVGHEFVIASGVPVMSFDWRGNRL